jgi:uncharacterized glyoxalase superfamily protein PhnB
MNIPIPDPFEALRLDDGPLAPSAAFASRLRNRLITELGAPTMTDTSAAVTTTAAPRTGGITPYLVVRDGVAALDFYRDAFGAAEEQRFLGDDGRIGHAEIRIGGSKLMLADEYPEHGIVGPQTLGGTSCSFHLDVDDVDAAYTRALGFGASGESAPEDQFHGNRNATVVDPFGHRWILSAVNVVLSTEEYIAAGAVAEGGSYTVTITSADQSATAAIAPEHHQIKHYDRGDLYYFTIPVTDLAKAQVFFGAVLGWQFDDPQAGHVSNIAAPPGGVRPEAEMPGTQLWFVVDDIHAAVAKVREMGGTSEEPVDYDSGLAVDCVDDQGTRFSLSVPAAKYSI